jgi:predicted 2-oxoglutarate/Fe(II)-dependent dioxygenase YbiX
VIESLLLERFFDDAVLARVQRAFDVATSAAASVYGVPQAGVDLRVRRAQVLDIAADVRELVRTMLVDAMPRIGEHFGVALQTCEESQFLRYETGDFFVAHQDGNTPLTRDDSRHRRVSAVIFVSARDDYEGGALQLHGPYPNWQYREDAPATAGGLFAFRAETTHEVTPVTRGTRQTIAVFYR